MLADGGNKGLGFVAVSAPGAEIDIAGGKEIEAGNDFLR